MNIKNKEIKKEWAITRFNDWLGDKLSDWLSTMAMFYGIAFLVLIPLYWQQPTSLVGWIQYTVAIFFQGVALPVLGYVSKREGQKQAVLIKETHDAVMEELKLAKEERKLTMEILKDLKGNTLKQ
jgi:hypothetical protein